MRRSANNSDLIRRLPPTPVQHRVLRHWRFKRRGSVKRAWQICNPGVAWRMQVSLRLKHVTHGLIQHLTLSRTCLIHFDPLLFLTWTASKLKPTTIYTQHPHLDLRLQEWNTEMAPRISSKIIPECLWCVTESCLSLLRLHLIASVTSYKRKKYTYSI